MYPISLILTFLNPYLLFFSTFSPLSQYYHRPDFHSPSDLQANGVEDPNGVRWRGSSTIENGSVAMNNGKEQAGEKGVVGEGAGTGSVEDLLKVIGVGSEGIGGWLSTNAEGKGEDENGNGSGGGGGRKGIVGFEGATDKVEIESDRYDEGYMGIAPFQLFWSSTLRPPRFNIKTIPSSPSLSRYPVPLNDTTKPSNATSEEMSSNAIPTTTQVEVSSTVARSPSTTLPSTPSALSSLLSALIDENSDSSNEYILMSYYGSRVAQRAPIMMDITGSLVWSGAGDEGMPMRENWTGRKSLGLGGGGGERIRGDVFNLHVDELNGQKVLSYYNGSVVAPPGYGHGAHYIYNQHYQLVTVVGALNGTLNPLPGGGAVTDFHEFVITDRGTALVAVWRPYQENLESIGGPADGWTLNCVVQEINLTTPSWYPLPKLSKSTEIFVDPGVDLDSQDSLRNATYQSAYAEAVKRASLESKTAAAAALTASILAKRAPPPVPTSTTKHGHHRPRPTGSSRPTGHGHFRPAPTKSPATSSSSALYVPMPTENITLTPGDKELILQHRFFRQRIEEGMMNEEGHELIFEWGTREHMDIEESWEMIAESGIDISNSFDSVHMNSIEYDTDHNSYILSMRNTASVLRVSSITGEVLWRLGGSKSDFNMGEGTNFEFQHHARWVDRNLTRMKETYDGKLRLSLFDNGASLQVENEPTARGLLLELDEERMTCELVQDFLPTDGTFSRTQGSMQVLENGNVVIGWGERPWLSEYDPTGKLIYDVRFGTPRKTWDQFQVVQSYRTFRQEWVGYPITRPALLLNATRPSHWNEVMAVNVTFGDTVLTRILTPEGVKLVWPGSEEAKNEPSNLAANWTMKDLMPAQAYVSWNGATEVLAWQLVGRNSTKQAEILSLRPPSSSLEHPSPASPLPAETSNTTSSPTMSIPEPIEEDPPSPNVAPAYVMQPVSDPILKTGFETTFSIDWEVMLRNDYLAIIGISKNGSCLGGSDVFFTTNGTYASFVADCYY